MRKAYLVWGLALSACPAVWATMSVASVTRPRPQAAVFHRVVEPVALVQASEPGMAAGAGVHAERPTLPAASALVEIDAFREVRGKTVQLSGSGALATQFGHIYAPYFLTRSADVLLVTFKGGARVPARLVSADEQTQLAVLKVSSVPEGVRASDLCVPSSEGKGRLVTMVYAEGRNVRLASGAVAGEQPAVGPLKNVLEVRLSSDAKVSGGILLDQTGSLVGLALATAKGDDPKSQSVYALPASRIKESVDRMVRGDDGTFTPRQTALTEA